MSAEQKIAEQMRRELDRLKREVQKIKNAAGKAEAGLEMEYFTLIDELQLELHGLEQKYELFRETHDAAWQEFKSDLERSWTSLRELIKVITGP